VGACSQVLSARIAAGSITHITSMVELVASIETLIR
jgi:hypothetical protein